MQVRKPIRGCKREEREGGRQGWREGWGGRSDLPAEQATGRMAVRREGRGGRFAAALSLSPSLSSRQTILLSASVEEGDARLALRQCAAPRSPLRLQPKTGSEREIERERERHWEEKSGDGTRGDRDRE